MTSPSRSPASATHLRRSASCLPAAPTSGHGSVATSSTDCISSGLTCPVRSSGTAARIASISCARSRPSASRIISSSSTPMVKGGPMNSCSSMGARGRIVKGGAAYTQARRDPTHEERTEMEIKAAEQSSLLSTISPGKRTRLRRLLFEFGPGNGTFLFLPIDQGIEHGPRDFFPNPASKDPEYQFRLAAEAGYSAIACGYGMASKYYPAYAGQVPLLLKLNSKTEVPPSDEALSPCNASVEDAVRLGADVVGYTLYVGSPRQDEDLAQLRDVRSDCDRYGMPLMIWAYPRGRDIDKKGGATSFYAIDYAARLAMEMGADVVKLNFPKFDPEKDSDQPAPYNEMDVGPEEAVRQIVESAGRSLVVLSGGSKTDDETVLSHTKTIMEAGGSGVIFGRNVWQREWSEALEIIGQIKETLLSNVRRIP